MQRFVLGGIRPSALRPFPLTSSLSSSLPRSTTACFGLRPALFPLRSYGEEASATAQSSEQAAPAPAKKEKKKKEKKEKKAAKAEGEDETLVAGGPKLHVKRKLCRHLPKKRVWTVVGEGRLLEFAFQNDDLLDHPTFVTPYPYGDEDEDQDEVTEALADKGKGKGQKGGDDDE